MCVLTRVRVSIGINAEHNPAGSFMKRLGRRTQQMQTNGRVG